MLNCFYKVILKKKKRESKTSHPCLLSSKDTYRPMKARVVSQFYSYAFAMLDHVPRISPKINDPSVTHFLYSLLSPTRSFSIFFHPNNITLGNIVFVVIFSGI